MTLPLSPYAATQAVIWGGLLLGIALGAVVQATRFCTMGALADWFSYGGTARLMMWALAVGVAAAGSLSLIALGWLDATHTLAWSTRFLWPSYLVGGVVFGIGMVLASGCPQRNLVKAGAGSLKAWVTLLVAALAGEMTLRGVLAVPRVGVLDAAGIQLAHPQDLGSMLAAGLAWLMAAWPSQSPASSSASSSASSPAALRWAMLALLLVTLVALLWRHRATMARSHWIGGALVGLLVPLCWALTGHIGFIPEHPDTLEAAWMGTYSHHPEALTFAAPVAHTLDLLTLWSDNNNTVNFGITVTLGCLLGSTLSALIRREFKLESFRSVEDMGNHLIGGLLMGFGGVTAMGCSIGQGISGLALLSVGSCLAVAGIVFGAWLALRFQVWRIERA